LKTKQWFVCGLHVKPICDGHTPLIVDLRFVMDVTIMEANPDRAAQNELWRFGCPL